MGVVRGSGGANLFEAQNRTFELSRLTLSLFIQQHIEAGWVSDGKGTSVPEGGLTERPWRECFYVLKRSEIGWDHAQPRQFSVKG